MTFNQFGSNGSYVNGSNHGQPRDTDRHNRGSTRDPVDLAADMADEPLEQIRDLLFGDLRRTWEARLQTLETRLQTLEDKLDALRHQTRAEQQGQLSVLAEGIDQLGEHVRRLTR